MKRALVVGALIAGTATAHADPYENLPARAASGSLILGEGWGCVLAFAEGRPARQCWHASSLATRLGKKLDRPRARLLPWLMGRGTDAGFDRVCGVIGEQIHCWAPPASFDKGPRELPMTDSTLATPHAGTAIADVAASFEKLAGQIVSVRGPLAVGHSQAEGSLDNLLDLDNHRDRTPPPVHDCPAGIHQVSLAVGAMPTSVDLDRYECRGDDSRMCCNVAVTGQTVVASGRLQTNGEQRWRLASDVRLCVVAP